MFPTDPTDHVVTYTRFSGLAVARCTAEYISSPTVPKPLTVSSGGLDCSQGAAAARGLSVDSSGARCFERKVPEKQKQKALMLVSCTE